MRLVIHRFLAVFIALAFAAASGAGLVRAQDDADNAGPAGQPPLGASVPFISAEGTEAATVTITSYADPFEAYDPSTPPERGYRFVEVGLTVENTGRRPFSFYPYSIYLQDTEGFLYSQTFTFRTPEETEQHPDYTGEDVPGGESLTGYIYFSVFSDAEVARIIYTDGFERLIFLADLSVEPLIEPGHEDAAPTDGEDGADGEDGEDGADGADGEDGVALELSEEECADISAWYDEASARFESLGEGFGAIFTDADPDPDTLREVADGLAGAADEQEDADVPEVAQAANDAGVAVFRGFADALNNFADGLESGEMTVEDFESVFADVEPLITEFDAQLSALGEACGLSLN